MHKATLNFRNLLLLRSENPPIPFYVLENRAQALTTGIKAAFRRSDGHTNALETDTKLLSYALAYSDVFREHYSAKPGCVFGLRIWC